jgi:hypothetical protein
MTSRLTPGGFLLAPGSDQAIGSAALGRNARDRAVANLLGEDKLMKHKETTALAVATGQPVQTVVQSDSATGGYQQTPWRTLLLPFSPVRASTVVRAFPLVAFARSHRRYALVVTQIDPTPNDNATGVYLLPPILAAPRAN